MDDTIESLLAAETLRGPRMWRGKQLAPMSRGLRDLRNKVVSPEDTADFHDVALLHILAEAYHVDTAKRLERRQALMAATDDTAKFRAGISLILDDIGDDETAWQETRRLVNEILGLVQDAAVSLTEKKSAPADSAEPSQTTTPCLSPPSSGSPADGTPISSAGS